jgi:CRP/FNR family transcriptional regulator, cyclic AMP receptor protein
VDVTLGLQATVNRLEAVDQLRECTRAQLEEVARLAERVQVGEGEVLAREGRIGREFFLILAGNVAVTRRGRRINSLGPGNFFGELAAMNPGPRNATVTALSELDVLIIGPREFAATANIPGFRDALFQSMARRLREADAQIADATDRQEHTFADTTEESDPSRSRAPKGSTSGERPPSHSLTPGSHRRWG